MGRPKKPTELRLLQGNLGKRPINKKEPKPKKTIPDPFLKLDADGQEAWNKLAPMLSDLGVLTEADGLALTILCQTWSDYCRARHIESAFDNDIKRFIVKSKNGSIYQNPLRGSINTLIHMLDQLLGRFGLNPVTRSSVISDLKKEENSFSEFLTK